MIRTFKDRRGEQIFEGHEPRKMAKGLIEAAKRKLVILDAAVTLADLAAAPGNRLEGLAGDRAGQHSIRINRQYRLCFVWADGGADEVEIVDYH